MEYVGVVSRDGSRTLVEFPDCPGCQTFAESGENVEEIAREALEGWLEVHLAGGSAPPRPRAHRRHRRRIAVRIDPALAIALQLRWRRQELNLSQAQLGERLNVSRQQVALLERPSANLRLTTLMRATAALEMTLDIALSPMEAARRSKIPGSGA